MDQRVLRQNQVWLDAGDCSIEEFRDLVEVTTEKSSVPLASEISKNVPIYDASAIRKAEGDSRQLKAFMAEWNAVFATGPGIVVVRGAYDDMGIVDRVTEVLTSIIETERLQGTGAGDHFAPAGANSRVWNAHEKLCMTSPEAFARYNANEIIPLVCRAWLGPLYQITTQVNVVRPGGKAQTPHRDYHMGFQTQESLAQYPANCHALSAALTLQGAIAHCDMPIESGPTKLLPYSQTYMPGYFATLLPEFRAYFEEHYIQLPLSKGDALFFNPATFHAAGENKSADIHRFANLMQVGSGYGRSIEIVDRSRMSHALFPHLAELKASGALTAAEVENVVAACAEGYPFPANLDLDSPLGGMAPESQQDLLRKALNENWTPAEFSKKLAEQNARKTSH